MWLFSSGCCRNNRLGVIPLGAVDPNKGIPVPFSSTLLSLVVMLCSGLAIDRQVQSEEVQCPAQPSAEHRTCFLLCRILCGSLCDASTLLLTHSTCKIWLIGRFYLLHISGKLFYLEGNTPSVRKKALFHCCNLWELQP